MDKKRSGALVLGNFIDAIDWEGALTRIETWALARESRHVSICNVHSVVTASRDEAFRKVLAASDMATPDGAPVAWMLRRQGFSGQPRVSGPDLMWALFERCSAAGISIYFYGSTDETLALLTERIRPLFPALRIAGLESPPFRTLTAEEDIVAVERINASGAGVVFVGLGCPKQESWMADHRGRVQAVMIGVGAAFDFHAGTVRRAPAWMRDNGLEWLHRLASEPGRLWKRYLVTNTLFIFGATRQLLFSQGR
jgi:N-acetylglucosaminyldiphosphoundecaprenol N-acetyl-beta-D-mannosaminyltransferase